MVGSAPEVARVMPRRFDGLSEKVRRRDVTVEASRLGPSGVEAIARRF